MRFEIVESSTKMIYGDLLEFYSPFNFITMKLSLK